MAWNTSGSQFDTGDGATNPILAVLSSSLVAYYEGASQRLSTLSWNGSNFSLTGNRLGSLAAGTSMVALSATRVAIALGSTLAAYDWSGTDWTLTGSAFTITSASGAKIAFMDSTNVAYIDAVNRELRTYTFNGSTWSLVGSGLAITSGGSVDLYLAGLSSTRVAYFDSNYNKQLRAYDWSGSAWTLTGSGLAITTSGTARLAITALTSSQVALYNENVADSETYDFDGSNWSNTGTMFSVSIGAILPSLTTFSSSLIAFAWWPGSGNTLIQAYSSAPPLTNIGARMFFRGMSSRQEN